MFSFLKNKQKEEQTACVLVVNSYSVTAAVVRTYHREHAVAKPVVLFSCEEKIPHHHAGGGSFDYLVAQEIKKVLEKCRKIHGNYDRNICVLGEPWTMTKTRDIKIEKSKAFKITQKIIDEAIARDGRLFEQEAVRDYAKHEEWGIMHTSQPIVDINGYRVSRPVGMTAKSMMMHVVVSLAPSACIEMIMGTYADVFHRADISFMGMDVITAPLVSSYVDASVLTFGGVSGILTSFHQGVVEHSEVVRGGLALFEDALAYAFDVNHRHISSVMSFVNDKKLLEYERDLYYQRIQHAYKSLGDGIQMGILEFKKHGGILPSPLFILGAPEWFIPLHPLLMKGLANQIIFPEASIFDDYLVYTHDARVKNVSLSLAILSGLKNSLAK